MHRTAPFTFTPLSPSTGAIVDGLDLARDMSDDTIRALISLLHERGVVVLRGQRLVDAEYVRFGHYWGRPLEFFRRQDRKEDFPVMIRIDNNPDVHPITNRDGAVHWHSDSTYEEEPAAVTMLYCQQAPLEGGITMFANTAAAFEALPAAERDRIDGLIARHELGQAPWVEGETQPHPDRPPANLPPQRHPLIVRHPVTGRRAIFTSGTACGIEGMADAEARALIRKLREHVIQPPFRASYKLTPGDIMLWDNFGVVHSATPIEYSNEEGKRRLVYRISTKGIPALCQQPS